MRRFVALLAAALVTSSFAGTHKVPKDEPFAAVRFPNGWPTAERGEFVEAKSPDGAVHFLVLPVERNKVAESMGEAMRYVRNTTGLTVDPGSIKNEPGELSGMDVRHVSWDAKDKNGDVKIRFHIVTIAENKRLLVAFWASPEAEKKHAAECNRILASIRKA